jgi:hypothetical protein
MCPTPDDQETHAPNEDLVLNTPSSWRSSISSGLTRLSSIIKMPHLSQRHLELESESESSPQAQLQLPQDQDQDHPHLEQEKEKLDWMISQLSEAEVEAAARVNYDYLILQTGPNTPFSSEERITYAKHICHRYLESKKGNKDVALSKVQATLKFRQDMDVDGLVTAFDDNNYTNDSPTNDYAFQLEKHLGSQHMFVQGYDKELRATFFFIPRRVQHHHPEWSIKEALYTMERAIACSKCLPDKSINAICDFKDFSLKHAPPLDVGQQFLTTLRSYYAGQVHRIFLVDAPTSFRILWRLLKGFVGTNTRSKIIFVSGEDKDQVLGEYYDPSQLPDFLKGTKTRELNMQEYLHDTRFDQAFDETE